MSKEKCFCNTNHYNNLPQNCLIAQRYRDGSLLTVAIIEGTLHAHLDKSREEQERMKKDYSSCCDINYCPICGRKLDKE